jgi:hypothetical protein
MHSTIAEATAGQLERAHRFFFNALVLAGVSLIGTGASLVLMPSVAAPIAFLTFLECLVAACAYYSSLDLLQQLAAEPHAQAIPAVQIYRAKVVRQSHRNRLAASIDSLISDSQTPGSCCLGDRVHLVEDQLRAISSDLATPEVPVHSGSALMCVRLLTAGAESPLFNPNLTVEQLRATLLRISYGIGKNTAA